MQLGDGFPAEADQCPRDPETPWGLDPALPIPSVQDEGTGHHFHAYFLLLSLALI